MAYRCPPLARAEIALQAYREGRTAARLAELSPVVAQLQLGLCKDCLREAKLKAYPRVLANFHQLEARDCDGLCRQCAHKRLDSLEIREKQGQLVFAERESGRVW